MMIFNFLQNSKATFIQILFYTFKAAFFLFQLYIQKAKEYATTNHFLKAYLFLPFFYINNVKE